LHIVMNACKLSVHFTILHLPCSIRENLEQGFFRLVFWNFLLLYKGCLSRLLRAQAMHNVSWSGITNSFPNKLISYEQIQTFLSFFLFDKKSFNLKNTTFWDMTPCSQMKVNKFRRTYRFHLQDWRISRTR
jgi:hypothetical protein